MCPFTQKECSKDCALYVRVGDIRISSPCAIKIIAMNSGKIQLEQPKI